MNEQKKEPLLDNLNKEQKIAVIHNKGPLRIIAGAGSGKTRVLIHKIAYLIKRMQVEPYKILAVTFTNKATNEMKERIKNMVPGSESEPKISTFHALCVYILRREIEILGYPTTFTILDSADQYDIIRNIYQKLDVSKYDITLRSMSNYISYHKINKTSEEEMKSENDAEFSQLKFKIFKEYKNTLKELGSLDFNDLLILTYDIFKNNPEISQKWSKRFSFILVDEFQDTSPLQYKIIKILAKNQNLTIVGDPDQTIYSWRGANVNLILNFHKDFPSAKTINLNLNYRSTEKILNYANSLIKFNKKRLPKDLIANNKGGSEVFFQHSFSSELEAKWVAQNIRHLIDNEDAKMSEIAIIYRANFYSKNFEDALLRQNIYHQVYGGEKFYERKEIKDAISYLKLFFSDSQISFQRILNVPSRSIGNTYREKITDFCEKNNLTFFEAIDKFSQDIVIPKNPKNQLIELVDKIKDYRKLINKENFQDLAEEFFSEIHYYDFLKKEDTSKAGKVENVKELLNIMKNWFKRNPEKSFESYFEEIALATDVINGEKASGVSLMNIHNCKGLEFDYVFLVGLSEEILPSKKSLENDFNDLNLEEERRLAYVAITRAKKKLFLSDAEGYLFGDFKTKKKTSRFIKEMGIEFNDSKKESFDNYVNDVLLGDDKNILQNKIKKQYHVDNNDIFIGDKITHKVFGEGVVVDEMLGQITVAFVNKKGTKTLLKNHASITKIID